MSPSTLYVFDGQSLGKTPFTNEQSYPYKYIALEHPQHRFVVCNQPGTTYATRDTGIKQRVDWLVGTADRAVLVDDGGTSDLSDAQGDLTGAQVLAVKAAYTAARRAAGFDFIVGFTVAPSVLLTGDEEVQRLAVNAALVADPAAYGYDAIVNLDAIPELADESNVAYYYDGTHWTDLATTLVAQALAAVPF